MADATGVAAASIGHRIGGAEVSGGSRSGPVFEPATGQRIAEVAFASAEEVGGAVEVARAAADAWGETSLSKRAQVMFALRDALREGADELAALITRENGKTLEDARGEIARGIESVEFACGIPSHLEGAFSSNASTGVDVHSVRQPVGVVAAITPFNFPVMVPLWILANAIACGNAVVLKPSEKTPSAALEMARMFEAAGLPEGVLNVVNGDVEAVDALLAHPLVDAVSSVGSTPVAEQIYLKGTSAGKRVQALGGAKNHMVVFPDADLDAAADAAVAAGYGAAGERCMAVSLVVAVGGVGDGLVDAIRDRATRLDVGPGDRPGVDMGPVITREHRDRVAGYVDIGADDGAEVVLDGRRAEVSSDEGFFLGPSLLDSVRPGTRAYEEEIFGPVLGVVRVDSFDEALELVNEHEFGNGVAVFTRDGGTARSFQNRCRIGMVGVNVPIPVPAAWSSFGGWKASLFGDTHMYGPEGIHFFTRQKVITSRWT